MSKLTMKLPYISFEVQPILHLCSSQTGCHSIKSLRIVGFVLYFKGIEKYFACFNCLAAFLTS